MNTAQTLHDKIYLNDALAILLFFDILCTSVLFLLKYYVHV